MKLKVRKIENSEWIKNIFLDDENIYFVDSIPNGNINTLCWISKKIFLENIKIKQDLERTFIAHPNPHFSSMDMISNTDIKVYGIYEHYIQNFVVINNTKYISFIINGKVFTTNLNNIENLEEFQIIKKINEGLIIKRDNKILLVDENIKLIKEIKIDLVDIIQFQNNFVIQKSNEEIVLTDLSFKIISVLDNEQDFKRIHYLNKNNVLISFKKKEESVLINILNNKKETFDKSFINRAVLLNNTFFLTKKIEKSGGKDFLNIFY
ncbi:hypothetical protein [Spiroplasma floricola]|uniref:Uncharacterized protein n=1 Tax=Spiroplasma floricola 23-6 TaxID=1336749 RepID=A0A2K8SEW8_9MOLU|nr:hypothetical protein [Spiroplasma floricola]AUB31963.1 hypothetical protein SFLOR_v1c09150 [Spiroplasma floricola 23-6]